MRPLAALPEASPKEQGEGRTQTDTLTVSSRTTPRNKNPGKTSPLSPPDASQPQHAHGQRRGTTRETEALAWADAERLIAGLTDAAIATAQRRLRELESVGQQRMNALHGGSRDALVVGPNLWAGVGLARGGAGTALVGSHAQVAERIAEYQAAGIEEFILSGYPHLEEAYAFAESVRPLLG